MTSKSDLSNKQSKIMASAHMDSRRNDSLFDFWSLTHFGWGILFGWLLDPFWALVILVLWEPLEILILSPLLKRYFNITFGFESLRNSLSDIFFDTMGVAIALWLLK
ncbi:MAG: hypothetical protein M3Q14_00920 [bacterium]|nr:hypothetical protein [bacterium]